MPRMGRVVVDGYPYHVVQRGHNRQVVFAAPEDYEKYLENLRELKAAFGIRLYGYCLMTNHVHLLIGSGDSPSAMGTFMKGLAGRTTRYRNRLEKRSGTLWESRYKSSLVQADTYLLACCRYIELNPVRARMTSSAQAYRWSSAKERLGTVPSDLLDWHPTYLSLGRSEAERRQEYSRFMKQAIPEAERKLIQEALQRQQLTGNQKFIDEIEKITGQRIEHRARGRPFKIVEENK